MREAGLLWLVFANLDVLIEGVNDPGASVNWAWHILHSLGAATLWWFGAYFDAKLLKE